MRREIEKKENVPMRRKGRGKGPKTEKGEKVPMEKRERGKCLNEEKRTRGKGKERKLSPMSAMCAFGHIIVSHGRWWV